VRGRGGDWNTAARSHRLFVIARRKTGNCGSQLVLSLCSCLKSLLCFVGGRVAPSSFGVSIPSSGDRNNCRRVRHPFTFQYILRRCSAPPQRRRQSGRARTFSESFPLGADSPHLAPPSTPCSIVHRHITQSQRSATTCTTWKDWASLGISGKKQRTCCRVRVACGAAPSD
jgi:hypothetical protein